MTDHGREIELLRCFYYAMELPVSLLCDGSSIFSMPDEIRSVSSLTGDPELSAFDTEGSGVQYISAASGENFIVLCIDERSCLAVGPFLADSDTKPSVTALVRAGKIKLSYKNELQSYLDSLPVISSERYFYAGKLLENLFSANPGRLPVAEISEPVQEFIQPEYYRQARDYRLRQFLHSPYMIEQEICRTISNGDTQTALRILKEINSRPRARLAGNAVRSLKNSVICSCSFMTRAAISGGVSPDEAFTLSDTYIQRIENCTVVQDIIKLEDEMVSGFTLAVKNVKSKRYSNAVSQALSYIDAHLCEPITVQDIADAVYLSPNYLSGLFVRETGETIHSCLIRRRIEEASYFVRSTADPFADIASFYQFSSQSHFVQSFKRIMGVTPGVYRRNPSSDQDA